jgi:hypothetical protein
MQIACTSSGIQRSGARSRGGKNDRSISWTIVSAWFFPKNGGTKVNSSYSVAPNA